MGDIRIMRIAVLRLTNFRNFKEFHLEFPKSNMVVFIGVNGAGKSSILDSIGAFLSGTTVRLTNDRKGGLVLTDNDIHTKASKLTVRMQTEDSTETRRYLLNWAIERSRSKTTKFTSGQSVYLEFIQKSLQVDPKQSIPVFVYYPANRLVHSPNSRQPKSQVYEFSQFYAYQNAFTKWLVNYEDFLNWFRLEEDVENEIISRENRNYVSPSLQTIRTALETFLTQLNVANFSNLRVVRERRDLDYSFRANITSSLEIDKDGISLKIEQLSEGEKTLLMTVCDIARRLTIANPALDDPKTGHGIVLIDEIDNHLHPQWQRRILPALNTTFPNCQFITTTHSPQVLSNLQPEEIFVLDNGKISNNVSYSYGRDSNSILYEFMGVEKRPEWMRQQLDHAFHLIDEGNTDAAKSAIEELKQFLGQNDPDIVRANTLLQFLYE